MRTNSLRTRNRTTLQVEALESRQLMTGTPIFSVIQHNDVLSVGGTNGNDHIWINDDGARVHVFRTFTNGSYQDLGVYTGVGSIKINTLAGNDDVNYFMHGTDPLHMGGPQNFAIRHAVTADLGSGSNLFSADVVQNLLRPGNAVTIGDLGTNSAVGIAVHGGANFDSFEFRAGIIGANSSVAFVTDGGAGNVADDFYANYGRAGIAQQGNTSVRLKFTGNAGDDNALVIVSGAMSTGSNLSMDLEGGDGNDNTSVSYQGTMNGHLSLFLTGDAGNDTLAANLSIGRFSGFGRIDSAIFGDSGNDSLTFVERKADPFHAPSLNSQLDGGSDFDIAHFTGGVTVNNIEELFSV